MKQVTYIEFPSGWRPPPYRNIKIQVVRQVRAGVSKNGNEYSVFIGNISDEDATYITLADPNVRIKNVMENNK